MTVDYTLALLKASPDDYWDAITKEVEMSGKKVRHAMLLNHQAAHLLAWANIARNEAKLKKNCGRGPNHARRKQVHCIC